MSVKIMGIVWEADLPQPEKIVLLAYADHADHNGGSVFPSVGLIAWKTGYSERSVQRITKELVDKKIMIPEGTSHLQTNRYRIDVSVLPMLPPYMGGDNLSPPPIPESNEGVTNGAGGGDKTGIGGDIAMSPEPSFKPSVNHHSRFSEKENNKPKHTPPTPKKQRTAEEIREQTKQSLGNYLERTSQDFRKAGERIIDIDHFPEDVREVVHTVCLLWHLHPPPRTKTRRGGLVGKWIENARDLLDSCGEFGVEAIRSYREEFEEYMKSHRGVAPFRVNDCGSLVRAVRGHVGIMRERSQDLQQGELPIAPEIWTKDGRIL